jgi:transposase
MPFRKPHRSDMSDEESALVALYLTLLPEDAGQREHLLREVFNGLRYLVRYGVAWRALPTTSRPDRRFTTKLRVGFGQAALRYWFRTSGRC